MVKCLIIACPHPYLVLCTLTRNLFHPCTVLALSFAFMVLFECALIDVCGMVVSTRFCKLLKSGARLAPSGPVWSLYLAQWGLWWPEAYFPGITFGIILRGWNLKSPVWAAFSCFRKPENHILSKKIWGSLGSRSFDRAVQTLEWHRGSDPAESLVTHFPGLSPSWVASSFQVWRFPREGIGDVLGFRWRCCWNQRSDSRPILFECASVGGGVEY